MPFMLLPCACWHSTVQQEIVLGMNIPEVLTLVYVFCSAHCFSGKLRVRGRQRRTAILWRQCKFFFFFLYFSFFFFFPLPVRALLFAFQLTVLSVLLFLVVVYIFVFLLVFFHCVQILLQCFSYFCLWSMRKFFLVDTKAYA